MSCQIYNCINCCNSSGNCAGAAFQKSAEFCNLPFESCNCRESDAAFVEEEVKKNTDETPYKHEGFTAQQWILVDYVNIVVHVFIPETRKFYNLEEMWSDAERMEHLEN